MYIYGRDYFDKLRSIGFTVEEDYTNKIAPALVEKYCLAKGDYSVCFKLHKKPATSLK
jgi:hypothetical protein